MVKTIKLDKNFYITTISIIIIILLVSYLFYKQNAENDKEIINIKIKNLETTIKNVEETTNNSPNIYNNAQPMMMQQQQQQAPLQNPYNPNINMDPKTINSLDRVYNPLRYPYKSD